VRLCGVGGEMSVVAVPPFSCVLSVGLATVAVHISYMAPLFKTSHKSFVRLRAITYA
jgi:hypothetical protein